MADYRISEVAERTGFSLATLRFYEEVGVVPPADRSPAGYRIYDYRALGRLAFAARARHLGVGLREVRELIHLWDGGECAPVQDRLVDVVAERRRALQKGIAELTTLASELEAVAARLTTAPQAGPCHDGCACNDEAVDQPASASREAGDSATEVPIVCTLEAAELPGRITDWRSVMSRAIGRYKTDGGMRIRFPPDAGLAATVAGLAQAEQTCCAFFDFTVHIGANAVSLDVRAPFDVEPLVDDLFGPAA